MSFLKPHYRAFSTGAGATAHYDFLRNYAATGFRYAVIAGPMSRRATGLKNRKGEHMLWTIAVVLLVLWALGLVSSYTMGGFIHILLVIAIIVVVVGFLQGRRAG